MSKWRFMQWVTFGLVLGLAVALGAWGQAAGGARGTAALAVDDQDMVVLPGNTYPQALPEFDAGPVDPSLPMKNMILSLKVSPDKQAALDRLLAEQQDPASPNFHKWLTPEEFGSRFGPSPQELAAITAWLKSKGFVIEKVANGRLWINFSGTAADVEKAFHTQIRNYRVEGKTYVANAMDPSIPRAFSGLVAGIVSLHNFPRKAMHTPGRLVSRAEYTGDSTHHYLAPGDFAIIYNVNSVYGAGYDGTGVTIAVVARTHPTNAVSDWNDFRSQFGLPYKPPNIIVNGPDPGSTTDDGEADLDTEWSGAVAKGATIDFVTSASTYPTDGIDLSAQYIVDNNLAAVMTTSYGLCEYYMGSVGNAFYNSLWMQAASQGISSFVSTGDNGVAGCDAANASSATHGLGVNGLASTPYNVAVGGTAFMDTSNPGAYWQSFNSSTGVSAFSYIPEQAWNESGAVASCDLLPPYYCEGLWSTSGGASDVYSKPSWQVAWGVPSDGSRDMPDVSLSAASHDGYLVVEDGSLYVFGGTSASAPSFAGLMALIVQKRGGARQGNPNPRLYQLGAAQYAGSGPAVFHDTTIGDNGVPGVSGYYCGVGYDLATGLGSVDAYALANNWGGGGTCPTITLSPGSLPSGAPEVAYSQTITASGGTAPYSYAITGGGLPPGLSLSGGQISGTPTVQGTFSFTVTATDAHSCTGSGSYSIVVVPPPDVQYGTKMGNPFRIVFTGSNLQPGIAVYINNSSVPWSPMVWKSTSQILLKGGGSLKAAVPKGVTTLFTFVNPDGGVFSGTWHW